MTGNPITDLHVACFYSGDANGNPSPSSISLPPVWSEFVLNLGFGGRTINSVPAKSQYGASPYLEISFALTGGSLALVSVGPSPVILDPPSSQASFIINPGERRTVWAAPGDKVAWISVSS